MIPSSSYIAPGLFDPVRLPGWPFAGLEPQAYGLIMADPPWRFQNWSEAGEGKGPEAHYRTMTLDDIEALPVADLAATNCLLWLWATAPLLDRQIDICKRWGFRYVTSGVWVKTTVNGKLGFGTGYVLRSAHEPFIIGAVGEPVTTRATRSVVMAQAREHSRKPDAAFEAAAELVPGVRRCELFSRESRTGWDTWGNECGLFDGGNAS